MQVNVDTTSTHLQCTGKYFQLHLLKMNKIAVAMTSTYYTHLVKNQERCKYSRKKVSAELRKLEEQDIEKVEGPTPWILLLVVILKKNGDVCMCVDMQMPNQAIQRGTRAQPLMI